VVRLITPSVGKDFGKRRDVVGGEEVRSGSELFRHTVRELVGHRRIMVALPEEPEVEVGKERVRVQVDI
jgi:hypothetical protein